MKRWPPFPSADSASGVETTIGPQGRIIVVVTEGSCILLETSQVLTAGYGLELAEGEVVHLLSHGCKWVELEFPLATIDADEHET